MNKLCVAYVGALLLVLHLTTQVAHSQNMTDPSVNGTGVSNSTNGTMLPTNGTNTTSTDKNGCVRADSGVAVLLLPLVASALYGWS